MLWGRLSHFLLEQRLRRRRGSELVFEAVAAAANIDRNRRVQEMVEEIMRDISVAAFGIAASTLHFHRRNPAAEARSCVMHNR